MTDPLRLMHICWRLRATRLVLLVSLAALLLMQTLGVLHRVAHPKPHAGGASPTTVSASGTLNALWGEHSHASDCQLFDQTCSDLFEFSVATAWATLPTFSVWAVTPLGRWALHASFYAARGPPDALN